MKRWLKITLTVIIMVGLTLALYFVGFKGEWIKPLVQEAGMAGYLIFILLQVVITTVMCFVPATTFTFSLLAAQLFGTWQGAIVASIACWLSSMLMFTIGDKAGEPFVDWLVGKESRIKAQNMISGRATVLVPTTLLFPFFPDDAICMVAGMTKMKYWYFAIVAALCRTVGVTTTCIFGGDLINYSQFGVFEWVVFINLAIIDVLLVWTLSGLVDKWIKKRQDKKQKKQEVVDEQSDK